MDGIIIFPDSTSGGGSIVIDSTPTQGSTNAVQSGGTKTYVDNTAFINALIFG
jgi:hypothetical protein